MAVVSSEGGDENKTSAITDSVPGVFTNNYSSTIFSVVRDSSTFIPKDMSCDDCSDDEVKKLTPSFWQVLSAWCFPFLLLWLRRSLLGTATVHLLRSLLMGEGINFVASQYGDVPKWVYSLTDPHAWPPPAFTILALITLIALIAHPDGLTWFMLGKLRDVLFTILHTVASCWTLFIQDYGIVTTTVALMTLTGIACLLGILLRNALPKAMCKRRTQDAQDRRNKKKRKGLKGLGRLKSPRKSDAHETSSQDNETSIFTHPCSLSVDSLVAEEIVDKHSSTVTPQLEVIAPYSPTRSTFRQRTPSSSTIDTTLDDTSCDSLSVRSFSSTPTAVTVGSTGNSESGKSMKRHGKKSLKNARLHHGPNDIQEAQPVPDDSAKLQKRQNISISIIEDQTPQSKPSRENVNQPSPSQSAVDNLKQSHSDASSIGSGDNKQSQTGTSELTGHPGNHHTGYKVTSGLSRYASEVPPKSPDRKQPLPTPPGRFSNLKERDTRFSNSRKNHGRLVPGKGKSRMKTGQSTSSTSSPRHAKSSENANRCKNSIKDFEQPSASEPLSKKCDKDKLKTTGTPSLKENRTQKFASSVQYGSPCNAEESITPKKLELGSFLASVGIVGRSDSKQTLDTKFSDSDDLERLSFQLQTSYPQMQNNLGRVWEQHQPTRWNHDYGRTPPPPPGLSSIHDEPPTLFGTPTHRNEATPNILTTSERFSPTAWYPLANPFVAFEDPKPDRVLDDEESRIEAELQELGGQMIGSILDF